MRTFSVIEQDLHPPYQLLIVFMLMLTLSAFSNRLDNEHKTNNSYKQNNAVSALSVSPLTGPALAEDDKTGKQTATYFTTTKHSSTPTYLERGDTHQFAD